ncbi:MULTISPECIES: hypothetical protein [unclassified Tolypothrix]|uniref:hypothetical protein n=1 Tax=unclassified Tolypothrix TaxID=2649714 RepID=UPI0005EAC5EC|nr:MULTISPECIES: hypothetical protein [unclassified Tolypothrix]BAY91206.1 hypothetical protein NIES3275_32290 [Microchaete diplosiphon NIES-3275]EKF00014.1 hypothetical protein FDUTEX481_09382 [Tolypothrix sp. PCC 7601]MBE9080852.1 hypothetical protein [Tolypothrix sp. LEGE 11397]UYD25289.1 hypothetical protein HGR01_28535 [Tolypothrix sp. PCC 7712]UYD32471.1 hypothetical protein HG267_26065 [Tolypothrix sp. PCC 7601]
MLQHFSHQFLVKSTIIGCLLVSSSLVTLQCSVANPQILTTPQAKTIAQQVLQNAIAKEKVDNTAKVVQVARIAKGDTWMYNPVPYWKIAIADQRQNLVYFTTDNGNFRVLMQRNGQNIHSLGKPAQEVPPTAMITAAIQQAKEWGYPGEPALTNISSAKTTWASGCENISAPAACDPILRRGWKITIPHQRQSWVFRGETADDLQLIARNNPVIERGLPIPVGNEIKSIASKHLQILPSVVLITKIEPQTFTDSCLGLGNLAESCAQQTIRGYRVTVAGKPQARQIYRISSYKVYLRTEAIAGLPTRTDDLPTAIARTVFNAAQSDLKQPIANLSISQVAPRFYCFRSSTAAPNEPCIPTQRLDGWNVTVTNFQKSLNYTVNLSGKILRKR